MFRCQNSTPDRVEKFDLEFLQRSIGRTVGVHMERATRACHATPEVLIDWRRSLGSQSLLAQLDKSPVAAALTTGGGIATWCSNRKRPFPDTGDMGAYMCVDHPPSNSRAPVATATTTASIRRRELDSPALPAAYCSGGGNNYVPSRRDRAQQKRKILISTTEHFLEGPPNFPFSRQQQGENSW